MSRLSDIQIDAQTLARAAQGEAAAQSEVYQRLSPAVFALICRLVADRAAAEDLFQDSLMAVFQHLPQFRGEAPFGVWVRRIATSRCFMHLRSPWQRARDALPDWGAEVDVATQMDLSRALARLPPLTRAVVWLHDVEGLTHEEIAQGFGRSVSFSKSQLSRAHRVLQGLLGIPEATVCQSLAPNLRSVP